MPPYGVGGDLGGLGRGPRRELAAVLVRYESVRKMSRALGASWLGVVLGSSSVYPHRLARQQFAGWGCECCLVNTFLISEKWARPWRLAVGLQLGVGV